MHESAVLPDRAADADNDARCRDERLSTGSAIHTVENGRDVIEGP